jgi:hypothetical protein
MYHFMWEIEGKLARVGRPGRELGTDVGVSALTRARMISFMAL